MNKSNWYKNEAILGSIVVVITLILQLLGLVDVASFVQETQASIIDWIVQATQLAGAAIAFYGNIMDRLQDD